MRMLIRLAINNMHNKNYSDVIYPFLQNNYSNLAKFCTTLTIFLKHQRLDPDYSVITGIFFHCL